MIKMQTTHEPDGIRYEVVDGDTVYWSTFVRFGMSAAHRAGGAAFVQAAHEQERVAQRVRNGVPAMDPAPEGVPSKSSGFTGT